MSGEIKKDERFFKILRKFLSSYYPHITVEELEELNETGILFRKQAEQLPGNISAAPGTVPQPSGYPTPAHLTVEEKKEEEAEKFIGLPVTAPAPNPNHETIIDVTPDMKKCFSVIDQFKERFERSVAANRKNIEVRKKLRKANELTPQRIKRIGKTNQRHANLQHRLRQKAQETARFYNVDPTIGIRYLMKDCTPSSKAKIKRVPIVLRQRQEKSLDTILWKEQASAFEKNQVIAINPLSRSKLSEQNLMISACTADELAQKQKKFYLKIWTPGKEHNGIIKYTDEPISHGIDDVVAKVVKIVRQGMTSQNVFRLIHHLKNRGYELGEYEDKKTGEISDDPDVLLFIIDEEKHRKFEDNMSMKRLRQIEHQERRH